MLIEITEETKQDFEAAAQKLGLSTTLPDLSILRPDLALWLTANYMMAVIIEVDKNGEIHDIADHSKRKYEPWHYAEDGFVPGSSGGGFSCSAYAIGSTTVGARLAFNSSDDAYETGNKYLDLWQIIKLNVR